MESTSRYAENFRLRIDKLGLDNKNAMPTVRQVPSAFYQTVSDIIDANEVLEAYQIELLLRPATGNGGNAIVQFLGETGNTLGKKYGIKVTRLREVITKLYGSEADFKSEKGRREAKPDTIFVHKKDKALEDYVRKHCRVETRTTIHFGFNGLNIRE